MNVLVIVGSCLQVNSSANLCHISYINGLIEAGYTVDLITVSNKDQKIDEGIIMPNVNDAFSVDASLYERLAVRRASRVNLNKNEFNAPEIQGKKSLRSFIIEKIKSIIKFCYGPHGSEIMWFWKVLLKYKFKRNYNYVISLSYPPVSHKVAETLIKKKKITTEKWIQIWEDPWYADLFRISPDVKIKKEEKRLLDAAECVYYVSPLTLYYQKENFYENSHKMKWEPVPTYYAHADEKITEFKEFIFGYFGDYVSTIRNLAPFYETAKSERLHVYICGFSDKKFDTEDNICVCPRMPLEKLKYYEDKANVLVFVCNLKGGQIPGKIYQYSATNKYILFILDGTESEKRVLREYFSKYERYVFCENNVASISEAIKKIQDNKYPESYYSPLDVFESKKIIESILNGE